MEPPESRSGIAARADFSIIRYAQCWEDADVLLEALDIHPGDRCFSVGSGGDNTLSMLVCAPAEVLAVDLSPAQVACIELKAAGFRVLPHAALLELAGITASTRRDDLYQQVRSALSSASRRYWDANLAVLERGLASAGKFETYFALFRRWILPLIHSRARVARLCDPRSVAERRAFYRDDWNTWRWRALFRIFFSRRIMGYLGRDPAFFDYVRGDVAAPLLCRAEHGLTDLDPSRNPYLQWIVLGRFRTALPHVWRPENFERIRNHVDRLRVEQASVETALGAAADGSFDRFNMSDIFEYISEAATEGVFDAIVRSGRRGGRVAYWNMLAPRRRPPRLAARLRPLEPLSRRLHDQAMTIFYSAFFVDELV
ncbi:MAG: S-adenosylmethionine:diacylglycerol 3-amino-3-carboxypropyl transferase [Deltaproteobacteria bacterium]|nr:S-adenosylmethionine:diacylglycerol 3-amino-3-carboxypropyl transferase [Deltaproteobacteria bacterium]